MSDVVVIGAGIGGLAIAARLARAGRRVTVVEKAAAAGGRTARLELDGYRFDTGPTLFLMPAVFADTFAALGERMEDHLDLMRVDPTYRVHFHDGSFIDLTSDLQAMREQLETIEPGAFGAYLRFVEEGYRHYTLSLRHFVGRNFRSYLEYFHPANLPLLWKLKALDRHARNVARYFDDPRLRALFSFQNMYLGLSPYDAPATYSLLQYTELAEGVWYPRGGLYSVIAALERIAGGAGVRLRYNAPVERIEVDGNHARAVILSGGERLPADIVVANADLPYVYKHLLPSDGSAERLERRAYTSSALMFYWAVEGERSPALLHHNLFLADHQFRAAFDRIFHDLTLPDEPSIYICAASRSDPAVAPPQGDALMALVPTGHINARQPQDWPALQEKARRAVIAQLENLGMAGVRGRIKREATISPPDYERELNLAKGAAFGLSHNFWQVGYLRPRNRHERYRNLYFAGASTHPGTGLPIVLLSARLTAERIAEDDRLPVIGSAVLH